MTSHFSRTAGAAAVLAGLVLVQFSDAARAQLPFFPGAEGYGATWFGSPGTPDGKWLSTATVYRVTSLADSGPGTLRNAFVENSSNKIIVFDVAGTINLTSAALDIKNLSNYYIAGQTAPGPITVYGRNTQVTHSSGKFNTNVVLRYLTFRKGTGADEDALSFAGGPSGDPNHAFVGRHMIFDHVSASWAEDENMSVANHNTLLTIQHSLIADALGGDHAFGSLVRPRRDAEVTFHHNLYANNRSRQPRLGIYNEELLTVDVRNNVVYNWGDRATYSGGSSDDWNDDDIDDTEYVNANYVGNYLIAGPATVVNSTKGFIVDKSADIEVYQSGNLIDSDNAPGGAADDSVLNGADQGWNMFEVLTADEDEVQGILTQRGTEFPMAPVTTQTATAAYNSIISHVGNSRWGRDPIDARIIGNVTGFTSPANGVGATNPIASELNAVLTAPTITHPVNWDTDNDAMPNHWEAEYGGNLVWNADFDSDGYINLLEYINERGEFPASAPIDYVGPTSGSGARYALIQNWRTNDGGLSAGVNWQPSKHDLARIRTGTVAVDAMGQHAGTLQLAPEAGDNATLNVTSGWIKVAADLEVGSAGGNGILAVASGATVHADAVIVDELGVVSGSGNIVGDVINAGLVTPGTSVGTLTVTGDYLQDAEGVLRMELDSAVSYDRLNVSGTFYAGGTLEIDLNYAAAAGDSFLLLDFLSAEGSIVVDLPPLDPGLAWDDGDLLTTGELSVIADVVEDADFNNDNIVDGEDFLIWQLGFNAAGTLENGDANQSGFVDAADLAIWESQYGTPGGALAAAIAAPEPATALTATLAALCLCGTLRPSRGRKPTVAA